jgi:hypothetical protein
MPFFTGVECSNVGEEMFTMRSGGIGRPSAVGEELVQNIGQKS